MKVDELRGEWALVTGASAGIGREFCRQLAERGVNLVIVARREERLRALAGALSDELNIRVLVIAEDLSVPGAAARIAARTAQEGVRIRLLVNNAAFGRWGRFESATVATYNEMLQANITAVVELTHVFLNELAAVTPSAIVNVASGAAYQPVPYMAVYAASKAFVLNFSEALYGEWSARGVLVQTLVPGPTESEFDQVAGAYASAISGRGSPAKVVQDSIAALERGDPVALNARGTFKQRFFAGLFPPKVVISQVAKMFRPPDERV
jgi:short-subunit dehydrogenase